MFKKGCKPTKETILKISLALKGKSLSEEIKLKMSIAKKGHKISDETKLKIGMANKNKLIGEKSPFFKGYHIKNGYKYIYNPKHPLKTIDNCVSEAHLVMEKFLGRYLLEEETIHHINGKTLDNRIENLKLFPNNSTHQKYHYHTKKGEGKITFNASKKEKLTIIKGEENGR